MIGGRRALMPILAAAAVACAAGAQGQAGVAPVASAGLSDALAIKCRGRVRQGCRAATRVTQDAPLPAFAPDPEPAPTETLAQALAAAYESAPGLEAQRYNLSAADEDEALALSELRPTTALTVAGSWDHTIAGRTTQATRFGASSTIINANTLAAQFGITQPLTTGGRASADRDAALAEVHAGRAQLRGSEGDTLLQVVTSYADVRRDAEDLRLVAANARQLAATLDEVRARREAGELTRTDIAQSETQLEAAEAGANSVRQQLEQDRAIYAAYVGHDPGVLAPPPPLPQLPGSIDAAFALAEDQSPDLARAIATERQSRARIAAAQAQGRPTLSLNGTATLTGRADPFTLHNEDQQYQAQAVLTIPLTNGGRVGALVAQAQDRNAADRIGIEAARRQMVAGIVEAWNGIATAQRNSAVDEREVASAQVFDEGTFEEYRAGLRSTFDVLYAHATLLNARVALIAARHDLYVAQATLLRRIGLLEARALLTGTGLYDPDADLRHAGRRGAVPWDGAVRALDRAEAPGATQHGLVQPPVGDGRPAMAPARDVEPQAAPATASPHVPIPGTIGVPAPDRSLSAP